MPMVAGILNIASGVLGLISCLCVFILAIVFIIVGLDAPVGSDYEFFSLMGFIFLATGLIIFIPCIISIIGGVFALKRKRWGWSLAGSICSTIVGSFLGIAAIIFIVMAKSEFTRINPQPEPPGTKS